MVRKESFSDQLFAELIMIICHKGFCHNFKSLFFPEIISPISSPRQVILIRRISLGKIFFYLFKSRLNYFFLHTKSLVDYRKNNFWQKKPHIYDKEIWHQKIKSLTKLAKIVFFYSGCKFLDNINQVDLSVKIKNKICWRDNTLLRKEMC